ISLSTAISGYFTGLRKVYKNAVISLCEQFVKITCTTLALITIAPKGIEYACLAVVGGSAVYEDASLISSILFYLSDKNKMPGKSKKQKKEIRSAFSRASDIAFPTALGSYVRQGLLCGEHIAIPAGLRKFHRGSGDALASYGTLHAMAFPLIFFPSSVIGAFASLLIPELCEYASLGQDKKVRIIAERVVTVGLIFAIGCGGMFLAFGKDMGEAIYSSGEAGAYICALAPLVPVMYIDTSVDSILKGLGEQVYCMKVNILDSTLSLALVLLLVPRFGTWGYIVCVYIAEIVNATLSIGKMISKTRLRITPSRILKPVLCIFTTVTLIRLFTGLFPVFDAIYLEICLTFVIYSALIIPKSVFWRKKSYKTENPMFTS
ncbi:MAG: polysaccharide biosynthesis C-terminal domain-containing protein, partial [Clostridia bacterium]|nr:polysaccharide biosynthesis C-terminal domain-containing protein [Clostridia bacterium]